MTSLKASAGLAALLFFLSLFWRSPESSDLGLCTAAAPARLRWIDDVKPLETEHGLAVCALPDGGRIGPSVPEQSCLAC